MITLRSRYKYSIDVFYLLNQSEKEPPSVTFFPPSVFLVFLPPCYWQLIQMAAARGSLFLHGVGNRRAPRPLQRAVMPAAGWEWSRNDSPTVKVFHCCFDVKTDSQCRLDYSVKVIQLQITPWTSHLITFERLDFISTQFLITLV